MSQLTFGSLFAGIGGFDLGFERAGMRCLWQVEKDPFCQKVLAKHWPAVQRFEDVKNVGKHNLQSVDVICGGFPCQPHSLAGKRRGAEDDRDLWPEYRRIIAELRPTYVIGENVPGIRTTILDSVLSDLEDLNYTWQSFIIPACAVDAPHRRDRVFIVAHANGVNGRPGAGWKNGPQAGNNCKIIPNANNTRLAKRESQRSDAQQKQPAFVRICRENGIETMAYANGEQAQRATIAREQRHTWQPEPGVGRTLDGFSAWLDRHRHLIIEAHKCIMTNVIYNNPLGDIHYANAEKARAGEILRTLRSEAREESLRRAARGLGRISETEVLLAYLCKLEETSEELDDVSLESGQAQEGLLRGLRGEDQPPGPSYRPESAEQRPRQHPDTLQALSRLLAYHSQKAWAAYRWENAQTVLSTWSDGWEDGIARVANGVPNRVDRLRSLGNAVVPQVAEFIGRLVVARATA